MSYHSKGLVINPPNVRHQVLYAASMKIHRKGSTRPDSLAGRALILIASMCLTAKTCQPGRRALGRMFGRSERSIARSLRALVDAGYIVRRRRGRKLTNVYRLAKALWRALTNDNAHRPPRRSGPTPFKLELRDYIARLAATCSGQGPRGAPSPA